MYQDIENTLYARIASKYGQQIRFMLRRKVDLAICKLEYETLMMSKGRVGVWIPAL